MKIMKRIFYILAFSALIFGGCKKEETNEEADEVTQKINGFIELAMNDIYLWYQYLPEIDIKYELDPEEYFYKLLYEDDKWSYITDNITELENSLEGVEKSFGYSLAFGSFVDASGKATGSYFAIVEFVYPNTPAAAAGIKRGDLIIKLNNSDITETNYTDILNGSSVTLTMGVLTQSGIAASGTKTMASQELHLDPVVLYKTITSGSHKIGYLFYAQYISDYNSSLDEAFQYFKDNQITDLVLDLRYNPGGGLDAAQYLCSSIAPKSYTTAKSTLVNFKWNDKYQSYWVQNEISSQITIPFINSTAVNLNLDKVHIITGQGTASASELTITGLDPYMDVVTIGDTTYGKYTASITIKPEDFYDSESDYADFKDWGLQPIVVKYTNSQGVTDFKDGFAPDILAPEDLFATLPLGETDEPLLQEAIEDITGVEAVAKKSAVFSKPYKIFDRGFSKYDPNKRELNITPFVSGKLNQELN